LKTLQTLLRGHRNVGVDGSQLTRVWISRAGNPAAMGGRWGLDGVASDGYKCQGGDDRLTPGAGPGGSEGVSSCYGGPPPLTNPAYKTSQYFPPDWQWPLAGKMLILPYSFRVILLLLPRLFSALWLSLSHPFAMKSFLERANYLILWRAWEDSNLRPTD
jgi:hypothetical protein